MKSPNNEVVSVSMLDKDVVLLKCIIMKPLSLRYEMANSPMATHVQHIWLFLSAKMEEN